MKVILLTDGLAPFVTGGMQTHSSNLLNCLLKHADRVLVVHTGESNQEPDITKILQRPSDSTKLESIYIPFPKSLKFPGHYVWKSWKFSDLVYLAIKKKVAEYDCIYSKGFSAWASARNKSNIKIPIITNFHGFEMFQKPANKRQKAEFVLLRPPVKELVKKSDYLVSYGAKITEILQEDLKVAAKRILEIPGSIDPVWVQANETKKSEEVRKFLFLGRYERRKGIEEINACLGELGLKQNIEFHFIGSIPEEKRMERSDILYHGKITDRDALISRVSEMDVLMCPSWSEGMPNVIMEAMSRSCAVIASDVGASSLLVSSDNGWLIEAGNIDQLKSAIVDASELNEELLRKKQLSSAQKISTGFTSEIVCATVHSHLSKLIENSPNE